MQKGEQMNNTIYRQDAIDAMTAMLWHFTSYESAENLAELAVGGIPPAQPEQHLTCKGCVHLGHGFKLPCTSCRRNQMLSDRYEAAMEDEAAKRLNDLICDINPAEICSQIKSDNLKKWCEKVQNEMKMALVQLPCWAKEGIDE
jgi:hypothetical protein